MQSTNIRALKKNPSQALRMARETGPVLILKGDQPDASRSELTSTVNNDR